MKVVIAFAAFLALFVLDVVFSFFNLLGPEFGLVFALLAPLVAVVFGFHAFTLHGAKSSHGRTMMFLSTGALLLLIGHVIFNYKRIFMGAMYPDMIVSIPWLLSYPFFLLGLCSIWKIAHVKVSRERFWATIGLISTVLVAVIWAAFSYVSGVDAEMPILIFLVLDLIVVGKLTVMMACSLGGKLMRVWGILLLSFLVIGTGHASLMLNYSPGFAAYVERVLDLGYVLMAFGFYYNRKLMKEPHEKKAR